MEPKVRRLSGSLGSGVCQSCDFGKSCDISALKNEDNNLHYSFVPMTK